MLIGGRSDALGQEMKLLGKDRELTRLGVRELAIDADDVAQVETFGQGPTFLSDLRLAHQKLNVAGPVLDVDEPQLASVPRKDDASRSPHFGAGHFPLALILQPAAKIQIGLCLAIR